MKNVWKKAAVVAASLSIVAFNLPCVWTAIKVVLGTGGGGLPW